MSLWGLDSDTWAAIAVVYAAGVIAAIYFVRLRSPRIHLFAWLLLLLAGMAGATLGILSSAGVLEGRPLGFAALGVLLLMLPAGVFAAIDMFRFFEVLARTGELPRDDKERK